MNMTQTTALLDQLRESRDIEAVLAGYQALTANHTTPLGLNQWQLSDKPTMEDFNRDNEIIDGKLRELDSSLGNKANISNTIGNPLQLAAGYSETTNNETFFFKDDFGRIYMVGNVKKTDGSIFAVSNTYTIATLPEGFRPNRRNFSVCYGNTASGVTGAIYPISVIVQPSGNIDVQIWSNTPNIINVSLNYSFQL